MHIDWFLVALAVVTLPLFVYACWLAINDKGGPKQEGDEAKVVE